MVYWHVWFCEVLFAFCSTKTRVLGMMVLSTRYPSKCTVSTPELQFAENVVRNGRKSPCLGQKSLRSAQRTPICQIVLGCPNFLPSAIWGSYLRKKDDPSVQENESPEMSGGIFRGFLRHGPLSALACQHQSVSRTIV